MCGRYSLVLQGKKLVDRWSVEVPPRFKPTANAAPGQMLPIIINSTPRQMVLGQWGFRPSWSETSGGMINARGETLTKKPFFNEAAKSHRCLVLAYGFYEWAKSGGKRQPYRFHYPQNTPFAMAGVFTPAGAGQPPTYAIVTTTAAAPVNKIHVRMPVILPEVDELRWLDAKHDVDELLASIDAGPLVADKVSTRVNSAAVDDIKLIEPVA
jgi:putative SOS response-associated peptidase YedK